MNDEAHGTADLPEPRLRVMPNGPYRVTGEVALVRMRPVVDSEGDKVGWERGPEVEHPPAFDLCRCGASSAMPFCDGTEERIGFDGTETAARSAYTDRAFRLGEGPIVLTDDPSICSRAAFCVAGAKDVWTLAERTSDPEAREELIRKVRRCPSGRLAYVVLPSSEVASEDLQQEVAVVDNGPYWVRGGIPVEAADGFGYEVRSRVALCRCGHSMNKPFCDGSHISTRFKDSSIELLTDGPQSG